DLMQAPLHRSPVALRALPPPRGLAHVFGHVAGRTRPVAHGLDVHDGRCHVLIHALGWPLLRDIRSAPEDMQVGPVAARLLEYAQVLRLAPSPLTPTALDDVAPCPDEAARDLVRIVSALIRGGQRDEDVRLAAAR